MRRRELALHVQDLVGSDLLTILDPRDGWPALASVVTPSSPTQVSLHVGPVGLTQRERDAIERRFQNPGSNRPITALPHTTALLIGVFTENNSSVLVGMNASSRLGRTTRFSLFMPLWALRAGINCGWIEHYNSAGEKIHIFRPNLLPIFLELARDDLEIDPKALQTIVLPENSSGEGQGQRQRRMASQLIRDARFSRDVCTSYAGHCAMCGLNYSLVVGAHIFPAAAEGSQDKVWNGVALCQNHHAAYDSHRIYVHPDSRRIFLHPTLKATSGMAAANGAFITTTYSRLAEPVGPHDRPKSEMFGLRYTHFSTKYDWVS